MAKDKTYTQTMGPIWVGVLHPSSQVCLNLVQSSQLFPCLLPLWTCLESVMKHWSLKMFEVLPTAHLPNVSIDPWLSRNSNVFQILAFRRSNFSESNTESWPFPLKSFASVKIMQINCPCGFPTPCPSCVSLSSNKMSSTVSESEVTFLWWNSKDGCRKLYFFHLFIVNYVLVSCYMPVKLTNVT